MMQPAINEQARRFSGWPRCFRAPETAFALIGMCAGAVVLAKLGWRSPMSAQVLAGSLVYALLVLSPTRWPVMGDARVRLGINYLFVAWFYGESSRITTALGSPAWDTSLLAADRRLFGETPSIALQGCMHPWVTDVMSLCYAFYHFYMHGMLVLAAFSRSPRTARHFGDCLYAGFAIGFTGYLLVPALGPGAAFPVLFNRPLSGGAVTWLNDWLVGNGAAIYGTFPSLHLLVTAILLDYDWRYCRRRFWWVLTPCAGLLVSTLYLRYHYAVDLLAGLVVFTGLRAITARWSQPPPILSPP